MNSPPRFPFIARCKPRHWLPVIVVALASVSVASARDDAVNPAKPAPEDLTPSERAEPGEIEGPAWQESVSELPPFPRAQDLIPFRADSGDPDYDYYIDVNSVALTADEVLRYTVIIRSPVGSSNIIHEGIRCATDEVKMFAYGTRDGRFEPMADPRWAFYHADGAMGYRKSLMEMYVCDENGWAMNTDTVLERLVMHDPRRPRFEPKVAPASD